jgi:4-hydroxy-2-oxoheptanedioate aldolase
VAAVSLLADGATALREAWVADEPTYGAWCSIPSSFSAELLGSVGFDWACIDLQHGLAASDTMVPMIQALAVSRTPTFVRVPWNEPGAIMRALDLGAVGVIVPMVNDVASARAAIGACRYAPDGYRSYGPTRAGLLGGDAPTDVVNRLVVCALMIETPEALANLDAILETPGVDAVFVGPQDLRVSLGLPDVTGEAFTRVIADVALRCGARGVTPGIFCLTTDLVAPWRALGYRMLAVGSDARLLRGSAAAALAQVRAAPVPDTVTHGTGYT